MPESPRSRPWRLLPGGVPRLDRAGPLLDRFRGEPHARVADPVASGAASVARRAGFRLEPSDRMDVARASDVAP